MWMRTWQRRLRMNPSTTQALDSSSSYTAFSLERNIDHACMYIASTLCTAALLCSGNLTDMLSEVDLAEMTTLTSCAALLCAC